MKKIKDRIILGLVSGLSSGVIARAINAIEFNLGLTDITSDQVGSSLFLPKNEAKTNNMEKKLLLHS